MNNEDNIKEEENSKKLNDEKKEKTKNKDKKEKENNEKLNELEKRIKELEEANEILNDKLLRKQADLQNYKRRKDEEVEKEIKYGQEDIVKEILLILDNFERAVDMDDDDLDDEVSKFLEGFKMIYSSFISILNNVGVKEIEAQGEIFDPNYHQAVLTDEVSDKEDNIVLEVFQKGYLLKDRILRPAMVKVNINQKQKENQEKNKEKENDNNE
jgi:molecular chaperone GrpE